MGKQSQGVAVRPELRLEVNSYLEADVRYARRPDCAIALDDNSTRIDELLGRYRDALEAGEANQAEALNDLANEYFSSTYDLRDLVTHNHLSGGT